MSDSIVVLPEIRDGEDKHSPLANRIRKNYRHIRKWARRTNTDCFRIYDRDIPEYNLAVDFYAGRFCVYYYSRHKEDDLPSDELVSELERALFVLFAVFPDTIFWKTRIKREKTEQYEKIDESKDFFFVHEYGVKFMVNLKDYLDTGLFLDHRETRQMAAKEAAGGRVLNLFAYTAAFSIHCAMRGARFTKTVDMSNTYIAWGKQNMTHNGLSLDDNRFERADCLRFLDDEIKTENRYDLIIIDPPTLSRSKKMEQMFDVQLDYVSLIQKSEKLLSGGGVIYFSTNSRRFRFDETLFSNFTVYDISARTIPLDFHDSKIHYCWKLVRKN